MSKNVIIVGMPRSGTSATAAIFTRRGYYTGYTSESHLREGDSHNPFGYFEADDLIEANVEVLRRAGYEHHNTWRFDPIPARVVERIRELTPSADHRQFVERYNLHAPWLWKDPRLCFTLTYWWRLVSHEQTRVIVMRRDPQHIYRSFRRMGWCPPGESARQALIGRVEQHVSAAEAAVRELGIPHLTVAYDHFKQAPDELAERLSALLDIDISVEDLNIRPELDHSTPRGRFATAIRVQVRRLPEPWRRRIERQLPERVLAALFSERRHLARRPPERAPGRSQVPPRR